MLWMDQGLAVAAELAWGTPLVVLILGGGIYFLGLSRLLPFRYLGHSIALLRGKYDRKMTRGISPIFRPYPARWLEPLAWAISQALRLRFS